MPAENTPTRSDDADEHDTAGEHGTANQLSKSRAESKNGEGLPGLRYFATPSGPAWPAEHTKTKPYSKTQPYAPFNASKAITSGKHSIWGSGWANKTDDYKDELDKKEK